MATLEESFVPILDKLLTDRLGKCLKELDDELFGCQFALNASLCTLWVSQHVHKPSDLGEVCKLHSLKAMHDFLAAFQLTRMSMHSQAANAIRLGCETTWQNAWFHESPCRVQQWKNGKRQQPIQIRKELKQFQTQRNYLYQELSRMAHPNEAAMVGLLPPMHGQKEVNLDILLPAYDSDRIRATCFRLFYSILLSLWDFDRYHVKSLNEKQRNVWEVQKIKMQEYYDKVVVKYLPQQLRLQVPQIWKKLSNE